MISVVVPTSDRPLEFLTQAVHSALGQTVVPEEVIVVDNGHTAVDAAMLPDEVRLYRLPPRCGPSRARNFGAAVAAGKYVAFLDDDDYWKPDFLHHTITAIEANGADCAYGHINILKAAGESGYSRMTIDEMSIDHLVRKNPGTGGINLLIRRDAFWLAGGYDESLRVSEDRALAIAILKAGFKPVIAPQAIAVMRDHDYRRQRHSDLRRLSFVWKYRKEMGAGDFLKRAVSIVSKAIRRRWRGPVKTTS